MILLCGIPTETPMAMVCEQLDALGLAYEVLHQRRFAETAIEIEVAAGEVRGRLTIGRRTLPCAEITGAYARLMDWRVLPEVADAAPREQAEQQCRHWHDALTGWLEIAPMRVINRAAAMSSNQSKPFQAQLIQRAGLRTPETLITNDPEEVHAFRALHGRVIYKSTSGVRSIVRMLDDDALDRLHLVRWCPVQFQSFIAGTNVRVHVVSGRLFATRIETDSVDYRYAHRSGGHARLEPCELDADIAEKCLALVATTGLELAGIDLLLAEDGETYCFEVNPSPAFSFFENATGQPIARAIAQALES